MGMIEKLEALLAAGQDSAMLRFGLGNAYLRQGDYPRAAQHLRQAVSLNPRYSAAWKGYGKALAELGRIEEASAAYQSGIAAAQQNGDVQSAREMTVFLRRLTKTKPQ